MGSETSQECHKTMDLSQWYYVQQTQQFPRLLRNRYNRREIEEYCLNVTKHFDRDQFRDVFYWRLGSQDLVAAINFKQDVTSGVHCGDNVRTSLFLQRILGRMPQFGEMTENEAVYVLMSSLQGFHEIYEKFGYVHFQEDMVCLNQNHKVKVWFSRDLASYVPERSAKHQKKTASDMCHRIIRKICEKIAPSQKSRLYDYLLEHCPNPNFKQAKFILKMFCKQKNIETRRTLDFHSRQQESFSQQAGLNSQQITELKNSLSRMLYLNDVDCVSDKQCMSISIAATKHQTESVNRSYSSKANPPTQQCKSNVHIRQESALTTETRPIQHQARRYHTQGSEAGRMETILSNLTTPKGSSITQKQQQDSGQKIVVPILSLKSTNKQASQPNSNQQTSKPNSNQTVTLMDGNIHRFISPKSSLKDVMQVQQNPASLPASNAESPKVSLKNIQKSREDVRSQFNRIRRTVSICVKSTKKIAQMNAHVMRIHNSDVAPLNNCPISYTITSQSNNENGSQESLN